MGDRNVAMRGKKAFTLIELLVVISVIALLMAILMPALQRVKRMAKAVVCQSNLRQWGLWFPMYTSDNDDRFFGHHPHGGALWISAMRPYYNGSEDVLWCPMTVRREPRYEPGSRGRLWRGSTFSAWASHESRPDVVPAEFLYGSYGLNYYVRNEVDVDWSVPGQSLYHKPCWKTSFVRGADKVPVLLDSTTTSGMPFGNLIMLDEDEPPPFEDKRKTQYWGNIGLFCINRHREHTHSLFLDFSVRKVGLKELWTLKWHPQFDTANEWTLAGGVKPDDWPDWMRKFKDY